MNMTEEEKYQDSITMTMIVFFESIAIITILGKLFFDMFDNWKKCNNFGWKDILSKLQ